MAKFSEDTLNNWRKPPSETEEAKLCNAEKLIREAIAADPQLSKMSIEVFGQGSYANDTNARLNSDIDINVCYLDGFFFQLPDGKNRSDFGLDSPLTYTFAEFKNSVERALVNKFGRNEVVRDDKCITVKESPTRVKADVVPTFKFRRFSDNGAYVEGAKFFSDKGIPIVNYPKQHIENGKSKNAATQKRFKRLTRIYRRLLYRMTDERIPECSNITSFLLECLVWNLPNNIFNDHHTWTERLRQSIIYLFDKTKEDSTCKEWGEVSELIYLFHSGRKWSRQDVNTFLRRLWNYLEF